MICLQIAGATLSRSCGSHSAYSHHLRVGARACLRLMPLVSCRETTSSVAEFLQLVEDMVEQDASFGLQRLSHLLAAVICEAAARLQGRSDACAAGGAPHHPAGQVAHDWQLSPAGSALETVADSELCTSRAVTSPPAMDGDEFLGWSQAQSVLNLKAAVAALGRTLRFLDRLWASEAQQWQEVRAEYRRLGGVARGLSAFSLRAPRDSVRPESGAGARCDGLHTSACLAQQAAGMCPEVSEGAPCAGEMWPWVAHARAALLEGERVIQECCERSDSSGGGSGDVVTVQSRRDHREDSWFVTSARLFLWGSLCHLGF